MKRRTIIIGLGDLKPHEEFRENLLRELVNSLETDGLQRNPIIVDEATGVILDGKHRSEALKLLGYKKIVACPVDYLHDDAIRVKSWRKGVKVTKEMVLKAGLTGRLLPAKTSRHIVSGRPMNTMTPLEKLL